MKACHMSELCHINRVKLFHKLTKNNEIFRFKLIATLQNNGYGNILKPMQYLFSKLIFFQNYFSML